MRSHAGVLLLVLVLSCKTLATSENEIHPSIDGMQELRLICDTDHKLQLVQKYIGLPGYDFLTFPHTKNVPFEVFVVAEQLEHFKIRLRANEIDYEIVLEDVSEVIENQLNLQKRARRLHNEARLSLKSFPRYDEIKEYLRHLAQARNDIVSSFSIGKSYEGRDIVGIKISSGGDDKPALFIDAGIHAREWIAPTTALYAIKQLVENTTNHYIFENIDIYIIPSLNPDGYEYSHKDKQTRMWRKTRSRSQTSACRGADPNRNFDYAWNSVGSSPNPCSETYAGSKAFSEPETAALRDFILARKNNIKVYLTVHSFGNYFVYPWSFTSKRPEQEPALKCTAEKAAEALQKIRDTRFTVGMSWNLMGATAGSSDDWNMGVAGIPLAYTIELPSSKYGFLAPPKEIKPVGQETFEAFKVFAKFVEGEICQDKIVNTSHEYLVEEVKAHSN